MIGRILKEIVGTVATIAFLFFVLMGVAWDKVRTWSRS